jgi:glycosyltransferase involved in cell wall biosynthesis
MVGPRLSFLISTQNRRDALAHCLGTISSQTYGDVEVVVVDDGSTDGTAEMVAERFPAVVLLRNEGPRGIGVSLQRASETATGDVWVNLDDDCYLPEDTAAEKIAAEITSAPDYEVFCFRCVTPEGGVRHREIPTRSKRLPDTPRQIAYFLGGAVAFRPEALRSVGSYPTDIAYGSWENCVAFRLFRAGHRIRWTPAVTIVHMAIPSPHNTRDREANYIRSELNLAARYLAAPYAHVHAILWVALYGLLATVRGHMGPTFSAIQRGANQWSELRKDTSERLTFEQTRRLSALGGRTWY